MIDISDLFTEDFILLDVDINSKDELFKAAAEHLYSKNIVNDKELFHFSYERYLINQLRKEFGLVGTPVRIIVREKNEKDL